MQQKVDQVMDRSKFNKVDLGSIFSFMKVGGAGNNVQKASIF